jgi:hypothetical protein
VKDRQCLGEFFDFFDLFIGVFVVFTFPVTTASTSQANSISIVNLIPMDELAILINISVVFQELPMFLLAPLLELGSVEIIV